MGCKELVEMNRCEMIKKINVFQHLCHCHVMNWSANIDVKYQGGLLNPYKRINTLKTYMPHGADKSCSQWDNEH